MSALDPALTGMVGVLFGGLLGLWGVRLSVRGNERLSRITVRRGAYVAFLTAEAQFRRASASNDLDQEAFSRASAEVPWGGERGPLMRNPDMFRADLEYAAGGLQRSLDRAKESFIAVGEARKGLLQARFALDLVAPQRIRDSADVVEAADYDAHHDAITAFMAAARLDTDAPEGRPSHRRLRPWRQSG